MAAAWAVIRHLGFEGYKGLTEQTLNNADQLRSAVASLDGIRVIGDSRFHLMAIGSDPAATDPVDVFALADALGTRGWFHDRQGPPDSLHLTLSNSNTGVMDDYVADLEAALGEVRGKRTDDRSTSYATLE